MPKGLSEKDLQKYHEAMYEVDYIVGETKIKYYPLIPSTEDSLYKNTKKAKYGDPIYLVGSVDFPTEPGDQPFTDSSKKDIRVKVSLPMLSFTNYTYVNEKEELVKPPLDPYDVIKGYFILDGKKFVIDECIPTGLFASTYTSYTYSCKGVDII